MESDDIINLKADSQTSNKSRISLMIIYINLINLETGLRLFMSIEDLAMWCASRKLSRFNVDVRCGPRKRSSIRLHRFKTCPRVLLTTMIINQPFNQYLGDENSWHAYNCHRNRRGEEMDPTESLSHNTREYVRRTWSSHAILLNLLVFSLYIPISIFSSLSFRAVIFESDVLIDTETSL